MSAPTQSNSEDHDAAAFEALQSPLAREPLPTPQQLVPDDSAEDSGQCIGPEHSFLQDLATRGLVLGWCIWLLGSWGATLMIESTVPAARWMVFAGLTGFMLLWPAIRLSQDLALGGRDSAEALAPLGGPAMLRAHPSPRLIGGPRLAIADWFALIVVFQAVIWPLRLSAGWSVTQTAWLDGGMAAWSLLVAAIVAAGGLARRSPLRALAMLVCVLLMFGEPALLAFISSIRGLAAHDAWLMRVTPLETISGLSSQPVHWRPDPWRAQVIAAGVAAVLAWVGVLLMAGIERRHRAAEMTIRGAVSAEP